MPGFSHPSRSDRNLTGMSYLASSAVSGSETATLFVLLGLLCLCGAAYMAYLRNAVAALLLVFVAVVAVVLGT